MSAYRDALAVDDKASDQRLALAAQLLADCEGVVLLEGILALRPTPDAILCEVIDPSPRAHRCTEEFKVLVENASRMLAASKLAVLMPEKPLHWEVVDDYGTGVAELWPRGKHKVDAL